MTQKLFSIKPFLMKKYEEINVGDQETLSHTITREDMEKFVQLTGDDNKLHVDESFAGQTPFKKPVVHGMLGASFISTIIGTRLPGDGALWFSQTLEFLLPVRIGDQLTVKAEVIKKNDKEHIIELRTDIYNQNRQLVTKGFAKVKVIEMIQEEAVPPPGNNEPRTALVIGGSGGIGQAACIQLAKDGFNVIIHYHSNKNAAEATLHAITAAQGRAIIAKANATSEADIRELVRTGERAFGKIDVLVNAAAVVIPNIKFQDLTWDDYSRQIDMNIKSVFLLIKELAPGMIDRKYGKIVNIGSMAFDKPNTDWSPYITAKGALAGLTKSLAIDLAPKGVRVNLVTPGMVHTELTADVPEKIKLLTAAQTPLRRLALVNDVADAISFLASERSDFITGETIRVNGGQVMI